MTTAVEQENQAQQFVDYASEKGFTISQEFIDSVVAELKAVGLFRESISLKTYKMGLASAIDSGKIAAPVQKPMNIERAAEALQNTFPPIIKRVRKESSTDFVNRQSGRVTLSERKEMDAAVNKGVATVKNLSRLAELRTQYRSLKAQAETLMGSNPRNHAETQSVRKAALAKLNADPKFKEVRD